LVAGFCWRYNNMIVETFEQMEKGAIGKMVAYYATYYTNPVKTMPPASTRPAGMSDVEWQIRNWYNFVWLCGDSLVEQAVHSADKIAWAMGDEPPVSCVGVGGRAIPSEGGNIYDHFEINYIYPNGVRAFLANRQIEGCHNENSDYILGADVTCTIGRGPAPRAARDHEVCLLRCIGCARLLLAASAFAKKVDFTRDVGPILEPSCVTCHNAAKAAGGLAITKKRPCWTKNPLSPVSPTPA